MKISKLFHWLYAILMFMPFGLLIFNALASMWSGQTIDFATWSSYLTGMSFGWTGVSLSIRNTYIYLINDIFGFSFGFRAVLTDLLTYWTCISIIWLIFDVFMYVPLLVHRWIDKAKIE